MTPLRDGMNLVAKEYIAAQDPDDPGVLMLSRFAGAARECKAALLVNPYDTEASATRSTARWRCRWRSAANRHAECSQTLLHNDIAHWAERFIATLTRPPRAARAARRGLAGG